MERALRWFLPETLRNEQSEAARQALMVIAGSFCIGALGGAVAVLQLALGVPESAAAAAACALLASSMPPLIRITGAVRAIGGVVCAVLWIAAVAIAYATDAALAPPLFYLAFVPALATLGMGTRAGLLWALATLLALLALLGLEGTGHWSTISVDPQVARDSAIRGAIVFDVALVLLAGGYEWLRGGALRRAVASEQRYQALAAHGSDLIAETDVHGRILFASPNHDTIGIPADQIVGSSGLAGVHRDDREILVAAARAMVRDGTARSQPARALRGDGSWRWFETSLTSYRTPEGEPRVLSVARDVTERLELEAKLRQSQKMEAVGQLASGAAHDFNNLLMVISGYAQQLAEQHGAGSEERAAADEILHAAERGADVTRRLLALSRPAGERREVVDLNAVVANVEQLLRRVLPADIALELVVAPGLPRVVANTGQLEQVILNLALNARDAMHGGGQLHIETVALGERVRLLVSDTGVGMDAATQERLFEPFFTTKPSGVGTGLGLFVVYSIVEGLGGVISVESEIGRGTRLAVDLPATSGAPSEGEPVRGAAAGHGDETILVAEDGAEVRELLRKALERAGYRILLACDGVEALEQASRDPAIALVVSDVVMPRMGGLELVTALRSIRPGLPILLVSGHPGRTLQAAPLLDHVALLAKPFSLAELRSRVRTLLDAAP